VTSSKAPKSNTWVTPAAAAVPAINDKTLIHHCTVCHPQP
jgi:hypothetical protein